MKSYILEVEGGYACFTRPEMKAERVSYDVITPSAAKNIFASVLWKPAIRWHVRRIDVLKPVKWASIRRNEVKRVAIPGAGSFFADEERTQRASLLLKDVKYRLHAEMEFLPPERWAKRKPGPDECLGKYQDIFERRAKTGQCFSQAYLGCREFPCSVSHVEDGACLEAPIDETRDLGWMLYDKDYSDPENVKPLIFRASMVKGSVLVPDISNRKEVRG